MKKWILSPLAAAFFLIGCNRVEDRVQPVDLTNKVDQPKLVVFFIVDQGMPSILEKYDHLFVGGYRWLMDNGVQFKNTYHEHGYTATGPAHFVLSSGQYPSTGGVIGNQWFDRELKRGWYCVEDTLSQILKDGSTGRSYRSIQSTTLGDWLKKYSPKSKVLSIAGKDRAAVLQGGKNADLTLWYDRQGGWTSSTYYTSRLPNWVSKFNRRLNVPSYVDSVWYPLMDSNIYANNTRPDYFVGEVNWSPIQYDPTFPIVFKELGLSFLLSTFYILPYGDRAVLNLGSQAVDEYNMGKDKYTDILFLGLSATDGIGHSFGPHSHEQLDNYLRLDKNLGQFIESLEMLLGKGNILYILSSDHGAVALPEYLNAQGLYAGRIPDPQRDSLFNAVNNEIEKQLGVNQVYSYGNAFYFDNDMNEDVRIIATRIIKSHLSKLEGIRSVITKKEIINGGKSIIDIRLKNMVHPEKSPDVYLIPEKYWTWRYPRGTSHGSPYDYDAHVPLIISRSSHKERIDSLRVKTVDIAPTIAKLIQIPFPKSVDGKPFEVY
jgi:predicted AlkP superfamily pyrophosphatase or phosphodiesterase